MGSSQSVQPNDDRNTDIKGQTAINNKLSQQIPKSKQQSPQIICKICFLNIVQNEAIELFKCSHAFCKDCIETYLSIKIRDFQEIICPEDKCQKQINQASNYFTNLSNEVKVKYFKIYKFFKISKHPHIKFCQSQNCQGILTKTIVNSQEIKICNKCSLKYCSQCNFLSHPSGECEKKQRGFLLSHLNCCQCKRCGHLIQKFHGCNHITCRCKFEFCYICGKQWIGYRIHMDCDVESRNIEETDCCPLCTEMCGRTVSFIIKLPFKLICYLLFLLLLLLIVNMEIIMLIPIFLFLMFIGAFGYSFVVIFNYFKQEKAFLGCLFLFIFPLAIIGGIVKAIKDLCKTFTLERYRESYIPFIRRLHRRIWG